VKAQPGWSGAESAASPETYVTKAIVGDLPRDGLITQQRVGILKYGGAFATMGRLDDALDVPQRAVPLNEEVEESHVLANDNRDAAEQAASIITGQIVGSRRLGRI
jgi:hypothetical protein